MARTELLRAVGPHGQEAIDEAHRLLSRCAILALDDELLTAAGLLPPRELRSLDAIHLAAALTLRDALDGLVTYDKRLADTARAANVTVILP